MEITTTKKSLLSQASSWFFLLSPSLSLLLINNSLSLIASYCTIQKICQLSFLLNFIYHYETAYCTYNFIIIVSIFTQRKYKAGNIYRPYKESTPKMAIVLCLVEPFLDVSVPFHKITKTRDVISLFHCMSQKYVIHEFNWF